MTGLRRFVVVGALLASLGALGLAPAYADVAPPPPPGGGGTPPTPPTNGGSTGNSGGPAYGQAGNCSVVSSPSYLGLACGDGSMNEQSIKDILGKDDVPGCWDDPLTPAELDAMMLVNTPDTTWYWERCLKGIDPKTKKIEPGGVHFTVGLVAKHPGDEIVTLTTNQTHLVNLYSKDGTIPAPIAGVSPNAHPRVGGLVSFFDGTDDQVTVDAGGVVLRARITSITVEPLGAGKGDTLSCDGTGFRATSVEQYDAHKGACWYKYQRSSAGQDGNAYPVRITAHWAVEISTGGGFTPFNTFSKAQVTKVPVTEIEAIVVP